MPIFKDIHTKRRNSDQLNDTFDIEFGFLLRKILVFFRKLEGTCALHVSQIQQIFLRVRDFNFLNFQGASIIRQSSSTRVNNGIEFLRHSMHNYLNFINYQAGHTSILVISSR